jgi:hypothetical protein
MTFLAGRVHELGAEAKGFDTTSRLTPALAKRFKNAGYSFCVRYLSRLSTDAEVKNGDLIRDEAEAILDAGLALMAVQHAQAGKSTPSGPLGTAYGNHAVNNAVFAGLPPGISIWLDLEEVKTGTQASDVIVYCNNWFKQVADAGYLPGIYVGANSILTSAQFFHALTCSHYWKSPSRVPDIAVRGYQMLQPKIDFKRYGIKIDENVVQADHLGGVPVALIR